MEIYLDIVILENIVINYLILFVTAKFSKSRTSNFRLLMGALCGTAYLVLMLILPDIKVYTTIFSKVLLSFAIVAVTFHFTRLSAFIKTLAIFYAATFLFAGVGFAFLFFNHGGGIIRNGVVISTFSFLDTK